MRATQTDISTVANALTAVIEAAKGSEHNITGSGKNWTEYEFSDRECFFGTTMYVYTARVTIYEQDSAPYRSWRSLTDPTMQGGDTFTSVEYLDVVRIDGDDCEDLEIDTKQIERLMEYPMYNERESA